MHMGRKLTVLWDEGELGNSVMLFTCSCCRCCPSQCPPPHLVIHKTKLGTEKIFLHRYSRKIWLHLRFSTHTCNSHPRNCSATEVKGGCTCSQVHLQHVVKKFNLMKMPQQCLSNSVTEPALSYTCKHNPCNIRKTCSVASASKNFPRVPDSGELMPGSDHSKF